MPKEITKEEVEKRLKKIDPNLKRGLDFELTFGKHKDKTIKWIINHDLNYIQFYKENGYLKLTSEALVYLIRIRNKKEISIVGKLFDITLEREINELREDIEF